MNKTALVFTCAHSCSKYDNKRAEILGQFVYDLKPDYVVDLGDTADLPSLSTHDTKYPKLMTMSDYESDLEAYHDFQEKLRHPFSKHKKKRPAFIGFEGNHEHRIKRALGNDPRLGGSKYGISFNHLDTSRFYSDYYEYEHGAPAIANLDGVDYAHFVTSSNTNRALSGPNHAKALVQSRLKSTTVGHSHLRNIYFADGAKAIGLVAGNYKRGPEEWAGQSNENWWTGVVVKRNIDSGYYDPQFISFRQLEAWYG